MAATIFNENTPESRATHNISPPNVQKSISEGLPLRWHERINWPSQEKFDWHGSSVIFLPILQLTGPLLPYTTRKLSYSTSFLRNLKHMLCDQIFQEFWLKLIRQNFAFWQICTHDRCHRIHPPVSEALLSREWPNYYQAYISLFSYLANTHFLKWSIYMGAITQYVIYVHSFELHYFRVKPGSGHNTLVPP